MSYVILYRNPHTEKVYGVVDENAYGLLEFDDMTEAARHAEVVLRVDEPFRIVEIDEL